MTAAYSLVILHTDHRGQEVITGLYASVAALVDSIEPWCESNTMLDDDALGAIRENVVEALGQSDFFDWEPEDGIRVIARKQYVVY